MPSHTIAVLAFDRISPFHLSVPCVIFGESGLPGAPCDVHVCAWETQPLQTSAGFSITPAFGLEALALADIIIVPSWRDPAEIAAPAVLAALRAAHARGAQVVGLCLGAYLLAQAGLLDGLRATTHWAYAQDFAQRFPKVQLQADVLYIEEDNVLTSAGTAAAIDCCLHMLRQRFGAQAANSVARKMVVPPHRQGGQAQYIEYALPVSARSSRLAGLLDQVRANLPLPHSVDSLAAQALMSRRSFTRSFRAAVGVSVVQSLLAERLALIQRLLEGTDKSIEAIAELAGFGSVVSLRHHFKLAFGVSPSQWRQTFQS
ncbi:MAG: helix-turn-helix domain-containing protein [Burkholderiales bacterium]|nr:helix-turn-helix domain-containing protein [Burkholderiales bacterium]